MKSWYRLFVSIKFLYYKKNINNFLDHTAFPFMKQLIARRKWVLIFLYNKAANNKIKYKTATLVNKK